jgi:hypothetical protein
MIKGPEGGPNERTEICLFFWAHFLLPQKTGLSLQFLSPPAAGLRYFRSIPRAVKATKGCILNQCGFA